MDANPNATPRPDPHASTEKKLAAAGWGLFFVWIGIAILVSIPSWVALLGIGAITLGAQAARKSLGLDFEGFWLVVGLLFLLGGFWALSGTAIPLFPVLLILAGVGLLLSIVVGRRG